MKDMLYGVFLSDEHGPLVPPDGDHGGHSPRCWRGPAPLLRVAWVWKHHPNNCCQL